MWAVLRSKFALLSVALLGAVVMSFSFAGSASAVDFFGGVCKNNTKNAAACEKNYNKLTGPGGIITKATNLIALIAGIAAVIVMLLGGYKYITSNGDSSSISEAKKTIIYALVGLIVIVLARSIVTFVVGKL